MRRPPAEDPGRTAALRLAKAMDVPVEPASKWQLNHLVANRPHQGLLLAATPVPVQPLVSLGPAEHKDAR